MIPTSAHGPSEGFRRASAGGFTLIEMLVVLLIMGLLVGLAAVIVQPDEKARLEVEAERLAQLIQFAAVQAQLTGKPLVWSADAAGTGYRFLEYRDESGWTALDADHSLRLRTLPSGMKISNLRRDNTGTAEPLRVEFRPSGALQSFSLDLTFGAARCTVAYSPTGEVRVVPERSSGDATLAPA